MHLVIMLSLNISFIFSIELLVRIINREDIYNIIWCICLILSYSPLMLRKLSNQIDNHFFRRCKISPIWDICSNNAFFSTFFIFHISALWWINCTIKKNYMEKLGSNHKPIIIGRTMMLTWCVIEFPKQKGKYFVLD